MPSLPSTPHAQGCGRFRYCVGQNLGNKGYSYRRLHVSGLSFNINDCMFQSRRIWELSLRSWEGPDIRKAGHERGTITSLMQKNEVELGIVFLLALTRSHFSWTLLPEGHFFFKMFYKNGFEPKRGCTWKQDLARHTGASGGMLLKLRNSRER